MNFRVTIFFFGLLLTTLWVFGLMIAHRKSTGDRTYIMPTLRGEDVTVDKLVIQSKDEKKELTFEFISDRWYLKDGKNQVRVVGALIKKIIDEVKDAKHDETANLDKASLANPEETVTLFGKAKEEPREWKLTVGKQNFGVYYVGTSDQEGKIFAVSKSSIEDLLVLNPNNFRSKRLFDFGETGVTTIIVKRDSKELELKRGDKGLWSFVKPALGFAGFDTEAPPPQPTSGVKALLNNIMNLRVEAETDFVALGTPVADVGLTAGKESMRIEIISGSDKGDKKETTTEVMLIGAKVPDQIRRDGTYYYARLLEDEGIFMLNARLLEPITKAVEEPGKIRSLDIAVFDEPKVDAVVVKVGKEEYQLFKAEDKKEQPPLAFQMQKPKSWEMIVGKEKKNVNEAALRSLLELAHGKKAIVDFLDVVPGVDEKKKDAEWGFDAPTASIAVYVEAVEKNKQEEAKKDEKEKKDEKDKKDEAKKDEKAKDNLPGLKKDVKPVVKLEVGKIDKDTVNIKRTLQDGNVSRFTVKKDFYDKLVPSEGLELALLDLDLPPFDANQVTSLKIERKTDKGMESVDLVRRAADGKAEWYVKDPLERSGVKLADARVAKLVEGLSMMHAKKWLKQLDSKEDLSKYGLTAPMATITMTVKKNPAIAAGALAVLACDLPMAGVPFFVAASEADKGEPITITLGKDTDNDKEKDQSGTYTTRSDVKLLFLMDVRFVKEVRDTDFRDRASLMHVQARQVASYLASAAGQPINVLMLWSPHVTGNVLPFDPVKVKEMKLEVRDRFELRSFDFLRDAKDKTWTDKSNIPEFRPDPEKVTNFLKDLAKVRAERFVAIVGGPRGEHRLSDKEAIAKLDLTMDDGRTVTLKIGANYLNHGFYATVSSMPEAVFMLPANAIEPMLRGVATFAKERLAAN